MKTNRLTKRILSAVLCVVLLSGLCALFGGCRKEEGGAGGGADVGIDSGEAGGVLLTHVFRGSDFPVPEGYSFNSQIVPRYDAESGALTFLATKWDGWEDEEGIWHTDNKTAVVTSSADGIIAEEDSALAENESFSDGFFTKTGLVWLTYAYDEANGTETYNLCSEDDAGERYEFDDVKSLFSDTGRGWFHVNHIEGDGDGYVYLATDQEIAVLSPRLESIGTITLPDWMSTMAADGEGKVWVSSFSGNGMALFPVVRESLSLGDPRDLPYGANELFFGPGHDLYYAGEGGLYFSDYAPDGKPGEGELFFDYLNSDISRDTATVIAVYGPEAVLVSGRGGGDTVPSLYKKAADIDLSAITVLRLAYTHQLDYRIPAKITEFNKAHDGVRIVTDSYMPGEEEEYYGGQSRLLLDMTAGSYRPDIVVVQQSGPALSGIVKRGLFADLVPYMEKSETLSRDNIMGCVLRTFTDADGRLFGLTRDFTIRAVITTDALLGKYAGRTSWTPEELLDFAENLPAGQLLIDGLTRETAAGTLLGPDGYAAFVSADGKSCSFDSDLFVRYLGYIASLPTSEEYMAHPPIEGMNGDYSERYRLYHEGKIVLKQRRLHELADFIGAQADFNTKDWTIIGQPTYGGCGTSISTESVYVITARDGERAELAWEALETLFETDEWRANYGIPALVSEFEREISEYRDYDFMITFTGSMSWGTKDPDRPRELREPGILAEFTDEDERRIRDVLDNRCGIPFAFAADEDVTAIVNEEISVFLGGVGTAEDCAKKIQSRVSILLAERG